MTVFISIATLLTLLVVVWVVRPLLWPTAHASVSSQGLNAAIYRDQLVALERDLARGVISQADFEATQDELQLRLLDDIAEPAATAPSAQRHYFWSAGRTALLLALLFPLGAASLYWKLGAPGAINPVAVAHSGQEDQVQKMVSVLAERLKGNPDDPKGWAMLARSYKVMGRLDEAEQAFQKVGDLINTEPDLMVDYADLLAVRAHSNIEGRPLELVNKALSINPQHPMALMMSGVAAYRRADFKAAITQWEKLLALMEPDSTDAAQIEADIAEARVKTGLPPLPRVSRGPADPNGNRGSNQAGQMPPTATPEGAVTPEVIKQMVERLAERLKANPADLAGWARLAGAYKAQGKLNEAAQAYAKAGAFVEGNADLLAQYADLLAGQAGNKIEGHALQLVNKALALNPKHPMALMMAGSAAYRRADYDHAIAYWETVLTVLPPDSSDATQVRSEIADARAKIGNGSSGKARP